MALKNSLVKKSDTPKFSAYLSQTGVRSMIMNTLKDGKGFISAITSAVGANPALQECTNDSIFAASLLGASLNLPPSPQLGYFYMVPFNDKKSGKKKAQFQIGYKGYIQLALRTGEYKRLIVSEIKDGELISWNPITEEITTEPVTNEEQRESLPTVGYYARFELINGFVKQMYWSREKMERHADKFSMAFNLEAYKKLQAGKIPAADLWKYSSFWYSNFDEMAKKTMLRQIIGKFGPMSTEMARAFDADEQSIKVNDSGEPEILEAEVSQPAEEAEAKESAPVQKIEEPAKEEINEAAEFDDPFAD